MLPWILFLFLLPSICAIGYPRYECGDHGRFEYCIDGVPGCIIGCHCHPGYYFDTETKICEPNAKLVQEYKRLYLPEPTRVQVPLTPADADNTGLPTPTTTGPLDTHVDAIAKNTDDLGDWLYNQFFKTIENQVINSTNNDKTLPLARRSGILEKRSRKNRKKNKKSSKRLKLKNKGLRRKLLRITDDDSLFDSDSDTDSDETGSSGSSDSDSDTTVEDGKDYHHRNDKEHGHRKILVINKKPKPPLPSFIFLPNLETPFYPPIGLAPPPAIPMYPVVPVPPMPVFPYPPGTKPDQQSSTVAPTTTQTQTPQSKDKDDDHKKDDEIKDEDKKDDDKNDDKEENNDMDGDKQKEGDEKENIQSATRNHHAKRRERQKMLKQMRQKMRFPPFNKAGPPTLRRNPPSQTELQYPDIPLYDELTPQDTPYTDSRNKPIDFMPPENVSFKYLSQLIHKINPNMTQVDLNNNINQMQNLQSRTFENKKYNAQRPEQYHTESYQDQYRPGLNQPAQNFNGGVMTKQNEPDSYYANLGQQIASLIRKIDTVGERQVNIDIAPTQVTPIQPMFNGNNFGSRSYWERYVRSPLNYFRSPTNAIQRNYENLFNLENKVETFATTEHALSLQEIENIIFLMDRAKSQFQDKPKNTKSNGTAKEHRFNAWLSNKQHNENFNINLLPRQSELLNSNGINLKFRKEPVTKKTNAKPLDNKSLKAPKIDHKPRISNEIINNDNLHLDLRGILMHNLRKAFYNVNSIRSKEESQFYGPNNSSLPIAGNINKNRETSNKFEQPRNPLLSNQVLPYISNMKRHSTKQSGLRRIYQLTPLLHNLRNIKYLGNKNKYGPNEIKHLVLSNTAGFEKYRPSYFHHEFHHFDYFD